MRIILILLPTLIFLGGIGYWAHILTADQLLPGLGALDAVAVISIGAVLLIGLFLGLMRCRHRWDRGKDI